MEGTMNRDRRRAAVQMKRYGESGVLGRDSQDEPEDSEFATADLALDEGKAVRKALANDRAAMDVQLNGSGVRP
jgi:hypothetical protein